MKSLTGKINDHLKKLNIKKDDNLIVHSNIIPFGIYNVGLPRYIINCILKKIGKSGSLAMPLYNLGLKNNSTVNVDKDYNIKENSILSKYYFNNYKVAKSSSIFHSHILSGALKKDFKLRNFFNSYGNDSDFDFFLKKKFKLILLGCDATEGCTYLHHVEFKTKSPFRIKKYFNFVVKKNSKTYKKKISYQVRKKNIFLNLNNIFFHPQVLKKTRIAVLKYGKSFSIQLDDLDFLSQELLSKNPKLILK